VSSLESALRRLLEQLTNHGARLAIVGGLAVSARTEPRFTRDADVCVAVPDDAGAEALIRRLQGDGYVAVTLVEQEAVKRVATVRLTSPGDPEGVVLDLLFASSGIEAEVVADAEVVDLFEGLRVPIATVPALIALKVLSRDDAMRPQDRVDLVALLRGATAGDLDEARRLLALIHERGYARGRDLLAGLASMEAELRRG
jgi:predicted nucleotidyltransferase